MRTIFHRFVQSLLLFGMATTWLEAGEPIDLHVDLSEASRGIYHSEMVLAVSPGELTLLYPKWLPGEHGPTGPVTDLAGIRMTSHGQPVVWERDPLDMFTFHVAVPPGGDQLEIKLDYLAPTGGGQFTAGPSNSDNLVVMSWNTLLLYPAGAIARDLQYRASLTLPEGWSFGTALVLSQEAGNEFEFEPVSLETLVDSPLSAGRYHRILDLTGGASVPHRLHLVADSAAALEMPDETLEAFRQLVAESLELFGAHHYEKYDFLLTLSDHITSFGLEHHESSDNRLPEDSLLDPDLRVSRAGLLPHEMVHSWNAKYRRPSGLTREDFQKPFVDDLLWVYEGLTSYLGEILTARSGLWTPEYAREAIAFSAAGMDHRPGREWRALADTTRAAQSLYGASGEWSAWRRGVDFYDEGALIWLEADVLIRELTEGRRSLDDFCKAFHGGESGPAEVVPFTYDELVEELNAIASYDWKAFFDTRVYEVQPVAPLGGILNSGWELEYDEKPNLHLKARDDSRHTVDLRFSLGLQLVEKVRHLANGKVLDVIPGSPAAAAGIAPGMKLLAVNGRKWTGNLIERAIDDAREQGSPIVLLVENAEFIHSMRIDYREGRRFPHLVRDESRRDLLSDILSPQS